MFFDRHNYLIMQNSIKIQPTLGVARCLTTESWAYPLTKQSQNYQIARSFLELLAFGTSGVWLITCINTPTITTTTATIINYTKSTK